MMNCDFLKQIHPRIIGEGDLKRSAVAIALTEDENLIFEVRSEAIRHQPGDICLPGGRLEKDEEPRQAVIRSIVISAAIMVIKTEEKIRRAHV